MISSVRNFVVRILDADRFTIVLFQILDIKSNYLPGIVHSPPKRKRTQYMSIVHLQYYISTYINMVQYSMPIYCYYVANIYSIL
jgi:hypothetical protein